MTSQFVGRSYIICKVIKSYSLSTPLPLFSQTKLKWKRVDYRLVSLRKDEKSKEADGIEEWKWKNHDYSSNLNNNIFLICH